MELSSPQSMGFARNLLSTLSFLSTVALENILSYKHEKYVAPDNAIFRIRLYQPTDNEAIRHLFYTTFGTQEGSLLRNTIHAELTGGATSILYIIGFMGAILIIPSHGSSDSYHPVQGTIMIIICLVLVLCSLHLTYMAYRNFINQGLTGDLLDVGKYYGDTNSSAFKSKNAFWVAEMITTSGEATIVGGIGFEAIVDPTTGLATSAELRRMMVSPICRRRGVAGRLMNISLDHGKKHGIQSFFLSTSSFQTSAIELYQKHGFVMRERWSNRNGIWVATLDLDLSGPGKK